MAGLHHAAACAFAGRQFYCGRSGAVRSGQMPQATGRAWEERDCLVGFVCMPTWCCLSSFECVSGLSGCVDLHSCMVHFQFRRAQRYKNSACGSFVRVATAPQEHSTHSAVPNSVPGDCIMQVQLHRCAVCCMSSPLPDVPPVPWYRFGDQRACSVVCDPSMYVERY